MCYKLSKKWDGLERRQYLIVLKTFVKSSDQVIVIYEMHKDKCVSRVRRAWGLRNGGRVRIRNWFKNRYISMMIAILI